MLAFDGWRGFFIDAVSERTLMLAPRVRLPKEGGASTSPPPPPPSAASASRAADGVGGGVGGVGVGGRSGFTACDGARTSTKRRSGSAGKRQYRRLCRSKPNGSRRRASVLFSARFCFCSSAARSRH